ncbi:hypothetical protein Zmor_005001 [Zophobas morio]|uniref:Uncharacterized protein n=1 Tax=Zophobas morio TaxID=2755281 RepID=A0AA38ITL4_9CUCU|nr:hypothetical protein Zmor_005001 [Zophobas morio]
MAHESLSSNLARLVESLRAHLHSKISFFDWPLSGHLTPTAASVIYNSTKTLILYILFNDAAASAAIFQVKTPQKTLFASSRKRQANFVFMSLRYEANPPWFRLYPGFKFPPSRYVIVNTPLNNIG